MDVELMILEMKTVEYVKLKILKEEKDITFVIKNYMRNGKLIN